MKKLMFLSCMILLLSGCSMVYVEKQSYQEIVSSIITGNTNLKSVSLEGYSYFLPQKVSLNRCDQRNSILYYNHKKMYLYVDLISYYHKVDSNYEYNKNSYFSMPIDIAGYKGYLEINKVSNRYFVEFMYHYSKIEAYIDEDDLKDTVTVMAYILNSIQINDSVLESLVGNNSLNYSEEQFNIFQPNGEQSDLLDYLEQYDDGRINSKNEDILDLDKNLE